MESDKSSISYEGGAGSRRGILVGKSVMVRDTHPQPAYFTAVHRVWIGKVGRVHAVVPSAPRDNPLVKVGFDEGRQIVFFRLTDLNVRADVEQETPKKHGKRGSHLPKA